MPSSILSHQAPALYLKIKFPASIDGTAICLSTFIPDLNVLLEVIPNFPFRGMTHSFIGQIMWTVPLTLLLTILFSRYFAPLLSRIASKGGPFSRILKYFGFDHYHFLQQKKINTRYFIVASYSALLGGLTHLLLDLSSHRLIELFFPWMILTTPDFLLIPLIDHGIITIGTMHVHAVLTMYNFIWMIETIVLLFVSLYLLRHIKKKDLMQKWYKVD